MDVERNVLAAANALSLDLAAQPSVAVLAKIRLWLQLVAVRNYSQEWAGGWHVDCVKHSLVHVK